RPSGGALAGLPGRGERGRLRGQGGLEIGDGGADRRGAVGAGLPERLERGLAGDARMLELGRADGADDVSGLDGRTADGAVRPPLREPGLERAYLDPPGVRLLERLGGPEEQVDERP